MNPTRANLTEFLDANGYSYDVRAEVVDDTQPDDAWKKLKATRICHIEISFEGDDCVLYTQGEQGRIGYEI